MSKYFLGSVGSAEAFRQTTAGRQLAFVCRTLTDSSINISTTKDDLRGGTGAPIVTNFYHDPNVEITLTDIFWKESYLEAQLGAMFQAGADITAYQSETLKVGDKTSGKITLSKAPLALKVACDTDDDKIIWYAKSGSEEWNTLVVESAEVTIPGSANGEEYCVRYLATDEQARDAIITSNIIPEELYLIITTPIFAGDACAVSNGKTAGTLTFEIPRFKLNGAQNFSFNMSSNTTMELSGTALADFSGCDMINGHLLRVIETIKGRSLNDGLIGIIVDAETGYKHNTQAALYGIYINGTVAVLSTANGQTWSTGSPASPTGSVILLTGSSALSDLASCTNGMVSFGAQTVDYELRYYLKGTPATWDSDEPYFSTTFTVS